MTAIEQDASQKRLSVTAYTLALNYLPLCQLLLGGVFVWWQATSALSGIVAALFWIYVVPPLVCRVTLLVFGAPGGRDLTQESRAYKIWWFIQQWQAVFNRLPWLDEALRFFPGIYAGWLWLWGAKVSPVVYWGPGSLVLDRSLVIIEAGAVIGSQAGLSGHVGRIAPDGTFRLDIAPPRVGRGALMGARSGIGPGAELAPGCMLPAGRLLPPFTRWDGAKRRPSGPADD